MRAAHLFNIERKNDLFELKYYDLFFKRWDVLSQHNDDRLFASIEKVGEKIGEQYLQEELYRLKEGIILLQTDPTKIRRVVTVHTGNLLKERATEEGPQTKAFGALPLVTIENLFVPSYEPTSRKNPKSQTLKDIAVSLRYDPLLNEEYHGTTLFTAIGAYLQHARKE